MNARPPVDRTRVLVRLVVPCVVAVVAACSQGEPPATPTDATSLPPGSAQQVRSEVGEASVIVVAMQTTQIPAEVATEYGIEQRDDLVMLRISPRRGEPGSITSAPTQVRATVTDLRGQTSEVSLEKREVSGLVDHVGTVQTALPETLRFDITVTTAQGATESLELTREFHAR